MRIGRGLLRIWLVVSALWSVAFAIFIAWFILKMPDAWPHPYEWIEILLVTLVPWIATLSVLAIRWIVLGFRSAPSN